MTLHHDDRQFALGRALEGFGRWMHNSALPFWLSAGFDAPRRSFVEHLMLNTVPAAVPYKRVRVQARQIYVYSHAAILGWRDGLAAAEHTFAFTSANGWGAQGGWVRSMGRDGGVVDPTTDLYDVAFMLFACAWHYRATGNSQCVILAHRTLDWLDSCMRTPDRLGFENWSPVDGSPRQQNPHMHLLEAALALHEATREDRFASLATEMLRLFRTKLFDERTGTLAEFFDAEWGRLRGPSGRAVIEPGHQFEWAWLLFEAYRVLGVDMRHEARQLYRFATSHGIDPVTHLVFDAVDEVGDVQDRSIRVWPQTEAIKAHLAMLEHDQLAVEQVIEQCTANLLSRFLARQPVGTWTEHFTPEGMPKGERIPTSSLYHLHLAYAELHRVAGLTPFGASMPPTGQTAN